MPRRLTWDERYEQLAAFHARHGHAHVLRSDTEEPGLGQWLSNQRAFWRRGELLRARVEKLRTLGLSPDALGDVWETGFAAWLAFRATHGHGVVPWKPVTALTNWVLAQRQAYRVGALAEDRRARLAEHGFPFTVRDARSSAHWEAMFARLATFRSARGHCDVPVSNPDDPRLTAWVRKQRGLARDGKLPLDRKARLEALGFVWNAKDAEWERRFRAALDHRAATGGWRARTGSPLQRWMTWQRKAHRTGRLPRARVERLTAAGFDWQPQASRIDARPPSHASRSRRRLRPSTHEGGTGPGTGAGPDPAPALDPGPDPV